MNRTDLAIEHKINGISEKKRGEFFKITEITVKSSDVSREIGKPCGRYVTLDGAVFGAETDSFFCGELSGEISELLETYVKKDDAVLVIGLGNNDITPDALGPKTAQKVVATRQFFEDSPQNPNGELADFGEIKRAVSVVNPGVLGQTGIETAEFVGAVCAKVKPDMILVIDALACADISRLGSSIQLTDTGICPGSGVKNSRKAINYETVGVPVIAVGIPTVMDFNANLGNSNEKPQNMMVTSRDIDLLIANASNMLAEAINISLHGIGANY